jgi:sulfite oxidase
MNPRQRYGKHASFEVLSAEPLNGNAPLAALVEQVVTPVDLFFVRNHGNVPEIDPADYRLTVDGLVEKPLTLTLRQLQQDFPKAEVSATLQCAGNRRQELLDVAPIEGELPWGSGAISHATWAGARLSDVLKAAGVKSGARHVAFGGGDRVQRLYTEFGFGGSIPLEKAQEADTLLAYSMNEEPLTPVHGYPVRSLVPGYIGARSVKWLTQITVQPVPSDNYFQQRAYKVFPPEVSTETVDWTQGTMLGANWLSAVICAPLPDAELSAGSLKVKGYVLGDGVHPVEGVEVSTDGGQTWQQAALVDAAANTWSWQHWEARLDVQPDTICLVARAVDQSGQEQPREAKAVWNVKGYANNAWHRVPIRVR